jgi:hypothetical protein
MAITTNVMAKIKANFVQTDSQPLDVLETNNRSLELIHMDYYKENSKQI